eukprot:5313685-Pyramimonas_sp.AAC.2
MSPYNQRDIGVVYFKNVCFLECIPHTTRLCSNSDVGQSSYSTFVTVTKWMCKDVMHFVEAVAWDNHHPNMSMTVCSGNPTEQVNTKVKGPR